MSDKCPYCGHTPKARKVAPVVARLVETMTDAQLYAEFKRTAPAFDLRFFIDHAVNAKSATMADACAMLREHVSDSDSLVGISRPEFYRRLRNLQDDWRRASTARESYAQFSEGVQAILRQAWYPQWSPVTVDAVREVA
jgi:hypothetical protein